MANEISRRELFRHAGYAAAAAGTMTAQAAQGAPGTPGELPFRHIHLDFHTSPAITGVGEDFNAGEFAATLKNASVNSITVFAKCHHGMAYYPTKVGVRHPNLKTDMLGEMVEACHKAGIKIPVYISTMYDQHAWRNHGDWRVLDPDGKEQGHRNNAGPLNPDLGRVCVNTPYTDYLVAQAEEVLNTYEVDGMFYDNFAYGRIGCCCSWCMLEREKLGLDSTKPDDRWQHAKQVMDRVMNRLATVTRNRRPRARVFINGPLTAAQDPGFLRSVVKYYSHEEIESLPGGSWGYSYFEVASRYLRNFGLDTTGMTGSFHRSWGDFGTVRNQAALDYECFTMLAQATKCAIGDHLHPKGRLNQAVYERIGNTYRSVAEKEPWCTGAKAVTEIGCLMSFTGQRTSESDLGVTGMLVQLQHQFDMLDPDADFSKYKILILPDSHRLNAAIQKKLAGYLASGGKLILSHESGLDPDGKQFVLPVNLTYEGPWTHEEQYLQVVDPATRVNIPDTIHESYEKGSAVKAGSGATVLARVWNGYFDRDYRHFQVAQTPYAAPTEYVGAAASGNIVYIATPIFRTYASFAYPVYRQIVANCITRLLPQPLVRAKAPSTAEITVTEQPNRHIVHILHYTPERRAPELDIVEDVIPLFNVPLSLRAEKRPKSVYLAPQRKELAVEYDAGYAHVVVPAVEGHQMIVFES